MKRESPGSTVWQVWRSDARPQQNGSFALHNLIENRLTVAVGFAPHFASSGVRDNFVLLYIRAPRRRTGDQCEKPFRFGAKRCTARRNVVLGQEGTDNEHRENQHY